MSSFIFSGGVEVLGFISPTDTSDEYAVIDPLYGIDGLRNVSSISELNAITTLRRRPGMVVGVNNGSQYYKLNPAPWNGTLSDWSLFTPGIFTGGTVSGETNFTSGVTATIFSAGTYLNLPIDNTVTGGTYNPSNGSVTFTNNTGGTFTVTGFITGFTDIQVTGYTYSANTFTIYDSSGNTFSATINSMTGLTVNGAISATTISASTYQNLPITTLTVNSTPISGGTSGRVFFENSANTLSQSSNLFWDTSLNRLGIGTTSPSFTVDIQGSTRSVGTLQTGTANSANGTLRVERNSGNTGIIIQGSNGNLIGAGSAPVYEPYNYADASHNFNIGHASSGNYNWYAGSNSTITLNTFLMRLTRGGNLLVGTTTNAGFQLDVNGTGRFQNQLTLSPPTNTTALSVSGYNVTGSSSQIAIDITGTWNTSGTPTLIKGNVTNTSSNVNSLLMDLRVDNINRFSVNNLGQIFIGSRSINIFTSENVTTPVADGRGLTINYGSTATSRSFFNLINTSFSATAGSVNSFTLPITFNPTTGTSTFTSILNNPIINQTGGSNGITRGFYSNPTLTSAADWRSIEWSNNAGFGLYGAGTANNYLGGKLLLNTTTDAGYQLDVNGTTRIQDKLSVGTPTESSAVVEITSTNRGLLIPRMTSVQKLAITSPAVGLMVFDTNNNITEIYDPFWEWMPIANQNDWMRRWGMSYWNDFGANNAFNDGVYTTFATNGGGQGATTTPFPLPSNPYIGFQGLRTGVNSNGTAQLRTDVNVGRYIYFGNGKFQFESRVFIRTLSTGTDRYNLIVGFSNSTSSTMTAGCTFIYDEGGVGTGTLASPNWQIMTSYLSVRTVVDTGVVVSASTFYNFRVDINDNSTVVNYYLNDILVRTETTNIPVDGSIGPQPIIGITKTVGTTDIGILVDYIGLKKKFRIPR